jgi:hypothetical protein
MTAAKVPLTIERGATFQRTLLLTNADDSVRDLTGHEARMQVRQAYGDAAAVLSLTSEPGGGIAIDVPTGALAVRIEAAATAQLVPMTAGVWDIELQAPDGTVYRLLEGVARITPEVTR